MFTLQQLKYFVSIVERGSLNKAAQSLYLSQPALTKQVALLERELACSLFLRKTTGIELTDAGRYFYEKACSILEQSEQAVQAVKRYTTTRQVRIGALPSLGSFYLPDLLSNEQVKEQPSQMVIRDTTRELCELLVRGQIDIAFVQDYEGGLELPVRPLLREPYVALLPAGHELAELPAISFAALCRERLVMFKDPCDIRTAFRQQCSIQGIANPNVALELDFNDSIVRFVAKGYGLSFAPKMLAESMHDPAIVSREFDADSFYRTIQVVYEPQFEPYVEVLTDCYRLNK
ncbi:LysR family transcriptional regulator [Brevibacillus fluminis]|uniref:LysR family transcriptional regulator n=1 Tax=Brevibacillus fluminis TaxID=511487 RepID=UPI003F8AB668